MSPGLHVDKGIFYLTGSLNFKTANALCEQGISAIIANPESSLLFDLAGVIYSDSAGLALLLEWTRLAARLKRQIMFKNLPSQMISMAKLCELFHVINLEQEPQ